MHLLSHNKTSNLITWLENLREFQLDDMFDTHILGRAFLYTEQATIQNKDENEIECSIEGTSSYVTQLLNEKGSIQGSCSCPYEGKCKHLAATILYLIQ